MTLPLKTLAPESIPAALRKARQYRWLNEPYQAESICLDILLVDPDNRRARVLLLLSLTDQFGPSGFGPQERRAREALEQLESEYDRLYYEGLIFERRGMAQKAMGATADAIYDSLRRAMALYEQAEALAEPERQEPVLRWNTCVRFITDHRLEGRATREERFVAYGD